MQHVTTLATEPAMVHVVAAAPHLSVQAADDKKERAALRPPCPIQIRAAPVVNVPRP